MWFREDQFQFLYKKIRGDFIIRATAKFIGKGVEGHRKIGIMVRGDLTKGSMYADSRFYPVDSLYKYIKQSFTRGGSNVLLSTAPDKTGSYRTADRDSLIKPGKLLHGR